MFDNQAPTEWRADLFRLIRETPALDWQLLTKRPQNIARMLPSDWSDGYANVWLGTTTEDAERYRMRWPILSRVPADRRFISYEPAIALLGRLDVATARCLPDWVICGGESGGHARVINPAWARHVRDQCRALGVPFLHKQWGTYRSNPLVQERGLSSAEAQRRDPPSNGKGARARRPTASAVSRRTRHQGSIARACHNSVGWSSLSMGVLERLAREGSSPNVV